MSGGRSGSTPTPPQVRRRKVLSAEWKYSFVGDTKRVTHDMCQQTAISGTESPTVGQANGESAPAAASATVGELLL